MYSVASDSIIENKQTIVMSQQQLLDLLTDQNQQQYMEDRVNIT